MSTNKSLPGNQAVLDLGFRNNSTSEFHKMMTTLDKAKFIHKAYYNPSSFTIDMQNKPQPEKVINDTPSIIVLMSHLFSIDAKKMAKLEKWMDAKKMSVQEKMEHLAKVYLRKKRNMNPVIRLVPTVIDIIPKKLIIF